MTKDTKYKVSMGRRRKADLIGAILFFGGAFIILLGNNLVYNQRIKYEIVIGTGIILILLSIIVLFSKARR